MAQDGASADETLLLFTVESAQHLRIGPGTDLNPYAIVMVGEHRCRTPTIPHGGAHPVFLSTHTMPVSTHVKKFTLTLMNEKPEGDQVIGTAQGDLKQVRAAAAGETVRIILPVMVSPTEQRGLVCVAMELKPSTQSTSSDAAVAAVGAGADTAPAAAGGTEEPSRGAPVLPQPSIPLIRRFLTMPHTHNLAVNLPTSPAPGGRMLTHCISDRHLTAASPAVPFASPHAMAHGTYSLVYLTQQQQQAAAAQAAGGKDKQPSDGMEEDDADMPPAGGGLISTPSLLASELARLDMP